MVNPVVFFTNLDSDQTRKVAVILPIQVKRFLRNSGTAPVGLAFRAKTRLVFADRDDCMGRMSHDLVVVTATDIVEVL